MDFETRLNKLERANRQLRLVMAGLALMLLTSIFFSNKLVSPTDAAQSGRDRLELKELTIKNSQGDPIVVLRGDAPRNQNPGIQLTGNSSVLECFDEADRKTVSIGVTTGDIWHKGEHRKGR